MAAYKTLRRFCVRSYNQPPCNSICKMFFIISLRMNQARLAPLLARRVAPAASLVRPTLLSVPCRFAGLGRTNSGTSWPKLLKDTADHGPELLVLAMYFVLTCRYILIIFNKN